MSDFRSFAEIDEPEGSEILLSTAESRHLVRVHRISPEEKVVVFNGRGREWTCRFLEELGGKARLEVLAQHQIPPPANSIALAQALPKGKNFEQIIRKATEIGVSAIFPLITSRTEIKLAGDRQQNKLAKWKTTAIEAAKQCGNSHLPEIAPVQSLDEFLTESEVFDLKLIASLQPDARNLRSILQTYTEKPSRSVWMVGPEGDFTNEEYLAAAEVGFEPVSLGPLVLRCETAAIYSLSILSYELQLP